MQDPHVLQEEAEGVPALEPVLSTEILAEPGEDPHRGVRIFSIIQVGSVWRTFLQSEEMILTVVNKWVILLFGEQRWGKGRCGGISGTTGLHQLGLVSSGFYIGALSADMI